MNEVNGNVKMAGGPMALWNRDVIPVLKGTDGGYYVSGRDIWKSIGVKTPFGKWFGRYCGYCMLDEGVDYIRMDHYGDEGPAAGKASEDGHGEAAGSNLGESGGHWEASQWTDLSNSREKFQYKGDFLLTLEAAKEIAMIQRSKEAHVIRRKLIELEHRVRQGRVRESPVVKRMAAVDPLSSGGSISRGGTNSTAGEGWLASGGLSCPPALPMASADFLKRTEDLMAAMDRVDARMGAIAGDAAFGRAVADAPDLLSATQIAKEYGLSAVAFNQLLAELGVQYKKSGQWLLYARYGGQGYTRTVYTTIVHRDNKKSVVLTTKWTPRGRKFLYGLLAGRGVEPGWVPVERVIQPADDGEGGGIDG